MECLVRRDARRHPRIEALVYSVSCVDDSVFPERERLVNPVWKTKKISPGCRVDETHPVFGDVVLRLRVWS